MRALYYASPVAQLLGEMRLGETVGFAEGRRV